MLTGRKYILRSETQAHRKKRVFFLFGWSLINRFFRISSVRFEFRSTPTSTGDDKVRQF